MNQDLKKIFGHLESAKCSAGSSGDSRNSACPPCGTGGEASKVQKPLNFWKKALLKLQKAQFCKTKNLENNEQRKKRFYKVRLTNRQKFLRGEGAQYS